MSTSKHRFATEEIEKFSTLDLISELKRRYQVLSRPERSCVLIGPAYSGVHTQASFLRKEWGLCTIQRNDIIKGSSQDLSKTMQTLSEEIGSFRCRRGFALSDFPQSAEEAKALDDMISEKHEARSDYRVLMLSVPSGTEEEKSKSTNILTHRATGVLVHQSSGRMYNTNVPELAPQSPNIDDVTGEPLVCPKRDLSSLGERLRSWWDNTEPDLAGYYGNRLERFNATATRDHFSVEISKSLLKSNEEKI